MPYKGQIIRNPDTGEYIEFIETAADTNGGYTRIKIKVIPGGFKPVPHMHTTTDESFEVISGRLTCIENGKKTETGPGQTIALTKGLSHIH